MTTVYGNTAAAWLTLGAESALLLFSGLAFNWVVRQSRPKLA